VPTEQDFFEVKPDETPVDSALLRGERDAALRAAVDRLPARDQELVRLLVAEPTPSYAQISAALQMPIGAIGPTRGRCLSRLRREADVVGLSSVALA
jgi:DNA-directed RNA polymerase specialized sigma24 family protein